MRKAWKLRDAMRGAVIVGVSVAAFTISASSAEALPKGWAYEVISPADSNSQDLIGGAGTPDGDHAQISAFTPVSAGQRTGNTSSYRARRTSSGWVLEDLADPNGPGNLTYDLLGGTSDLSNAIVRVCDRTMLSCTGDTQFQKIAPDGTRTLMATAPQSDFGAPLPGYVGLSSNGSSLFFQTPSGQPNLLAEDTHSHGHGLYRSDDGQLAFLGFDQNGDVLPCGGSFGNSVADVTAVAWGNGFEQNGLSADGDTTVFVSPDPHEITIGECSGPVDLYVRRGGTTVDISAPQNANPDQGATYVGNSRDGNLVFFTTTSQLVPGDTDAASDIYRYDVPSGTLARITPPGADVTVNHRAEGDISMVAVSPNADYIYFVANNSINGEGTDGAQNLYLYHDGAITHIVTASTGQIFVGSAMLNGTPSPITPDGTHLLFFSNDPLTGQPTGGTEQVFQFSVGTGQVACVSCHPDGSTPTTSIIYPTLNIDDRIQSDDGKAAVFQTTESLLSQDTNGVSDVYLWQSGTLSLVSSGHDPRPSILANMSADGHTVFFGSYERLVPTVDQENRKLYAARLGGGFKVVTRPACSDDACQGLPGLAPSVPPPGSMSLIGPGNLVRASSARLVLGAVGSKARLHLARTGDLTVRLRTNRDGKVRVRLAVRLGGKWVAADLAARMVRKPGSFRVTLHLPRRALRELATRGALRVRIVATQSGLPAAQRRTVLVRAA